VIAGVGNVVVFVPQIVVLFLFLGLLEDSGYLARAAFLLDRVLSRVGLHGRAFVPMLSGFACAVPAILAARTIENRRDRLVTILVTPLISCSARLPVYGLMIATVFATRAPVLGFIQVGTIVMISMYALSITAALCMAALFKRTLLATAPSPFVLELPPYRRPHLRALTRHVWSKVSSFLVSAGTVILAITILLWALFNFPRSPQLESDYATAKIALAAAPDAGERDSQLAALEAKFAKQRLEQSVAGRVGHAIEPVLRPFGWDWKVGVGLIASFAAREVLVSTLGLVYGLGQGAEEHPESLQDAMRNDRDSAGRPVHTPLSGLSLMVFFVLAMQCASTLATVRRETGSWRWPAFQFAYMLVLALAGSFVVYQGGRWLGFN
jgi:ferrous iron transport protein B